MVAVNRVFIAGNVTRAPEMKKVGNGVDLAKFAVAINKYGPGKDPQSRQHSAMFVNVVAFNRLAEQCQRLLDKGRRVWIEGELNISQYQDRQGVQRYWTEVAARSLQVLDRGTEVKGERGDTVGGTGQGTDDHAIAHDAAGDAESAAGADDQGNGSEKNGNAGETGDAVGGRASRQRRRSVGKPQDVAPVRGEEEDLPF